MDRDHDIGGARWPYNADDDREEKRRDHGDNDDHDDGRSHDAASPKLFDLLGSQFVVHPRILVDSGAPCVSNTCSISLAGWHGTQSFTHTRTSASSTVPLIRTNSSRRQPNGGTRRSPSPITTDFAVPPKST